MASDRSSYSASDSVRHIWQQLQLPEEALLHLELTGQGRGYLSSYEIGHLAQASIALSALSASLVDSLRGVSTIKQVTVPLDRACIEFESERLYTLDGLQPKETIKPIGGLHKTIDGYVRIHDGFPNHRNGALKLLGLPLEATREQVARRVAEWKKLDLEQAGHESDLAIYALRSYDEWDALPQAKAVPDWPLAVTQLSSERVERVPGLPKHMLERHDRCLRGLRIIELSRVLAAPVAGRTLAAHGADVLWVTSPNLPDLPTLDKDTARGKRTVQLDIDQQHDRQKLLDLLKDCDVFLQSYRPGALEAKGFGPEELASVNPDLIYASLTAFGSKGPWAIRRGFDSLVQTCTGMNVSEAEHFGNIGGEEARPMPVQALDHASGYLLATGIAAAVYKRAIAGGSWRVDVSLAGTMKYLRSLGQTKPEGSPGVDGIIPDDADVPAHYFEERPTGFGSMKAVRHAAVVKSAVPGWDHMPKPLGSDKAEWL